MKFRVKAIRIVLETYGIEAENAEKAKEIVQAGTHLPITTAAREFTVTTVREVIKESELVAAIKQEINNVSTINELVLYYNLSHQEEITVDDVIHGE